MCTNNKIAVLLSVLLYCYSSTLPGYAFKIGCLGHIGSGSALATECEELMVNLGVDFDIKTDSTRTGRVLKRGQPSLGFEIGAELQVPIVPLGILSVKFGRFSDVTGM